MQHIDFEAAVKAFQVKFRHFESPKRVTLDIPDEVKTLRIDMIKEEYKELMDAIHTDDLVEIADGACDLIYVLIGAMLCYGMPVNRLFQEVQNSNMTKELDLSVKGSKYGTKTPKGPNYIAPDIHSILFHPEKFTLLEKKQSAGGGEVLHDGEWHLWKETR